MTFKDNAELIKRTEALKALPEAAVTLMRTVVNQQLAKGNDEGLAMRVGWEMVKSRFTPVDGVWVARTDAFVETQYYTFEAQPAESFITRTEDGTEIHNYVLTDAWPDSFGTAPTQELITEWANAINQMQPEGDADHELYEQATKLYGGDIEKVERMLASKKGIGKIVKAHAKDGQLVVSVAFDKRYAKHVPNIRGLSIEAAAVRDTLTNKFKKGKFLGFTFAMNQKPSNPRAVRLA